MKKNAKIELREQERLKEKQTRTQDEEEQYLQYRGNSMPYRLHKEIVWMIGE